MTEEAKTTTNAELSEIVYGQMTLAEKEEVLSFLKASYPETPRQSDPTFWDWHFLEQPNVGEGEVPVCLARGGTRIAGQLAAIKVGLNVSGVTVPSMWILDLLVDPDFRRRGIMKKLVVITEGHTPYLLGLNTNKQHSPALLMSLGWKIVTKIPRFHKILFAGNAIKELGNLAPLRGLLNLPSVVFRRSRLHRAADIRRLSSFDTSVDELWSEARGQWPCSIERSAETLNWQYCEQPYKKFEMLGYFEGERMLGYTVLFFRKPNSNGVVDKAAISDICYHPSEPAKIVDALIAAALELAIERRVGGLVVDVMDKVLEERFAHFGFWRVKSDLQLMVKAPEGQEVLYDGANWFLTRGDSDISIFEHPNI